MPGELKGGRLGVALAIAVGIAVLMVGLKRRGDALPCAERLDPDPCWVETVDAALPEDAEAAVEALEAIEDPTLRLQAGAPMLERYDVVFSADQARRVCAALAPTVNTDFCTRQLNAVHLRQPGPPPVR